MLQAQAGDPSPFDRVGLPSRSSPLTTTAPHAFGRVYP